MVISVVLLAGEAAANRGGSSGRNSQPSLPGADVPGAPVSDCDMVQKSSLTPHWPQILQHTFRGQGFSLARSVPFGGSLVPGTWSSVNVITTPHQVKSGGTSYSRSANSILMMYRISVKVMAWLGRFPDSPKQVRASVAFQN